MAVTIKTIKQPIFDNPILVKAGGTYPYSDELMEACSKVDRYGEEYNLATIIGAGAAKRIMVPRNIVGKIGPDTKDGRCDGAPFKFMSAFVPRDDRQVRIVEGAVELLSAGENFIIEASTGIGKTICAMDIIAQVGLKTIVVVTKEDIRDQWIKAAKDILGLEVGKGVGIIQGDTVVVKGQGLVIAMIQSLSKDARYPSHTFEDFGLAIWDECFPAGTMVGGTPIEKYSIGDSVTAFAGSLVDSRVTWIGKKLGTYFVKTSGRGYTLVSTATQPIFVVGVGFIPAALVEDGDYVLRQVQPAGAITVQEDQRAVQEGSPGLLLQGARGAIPAGKIDLEVRGLSGGVQSSSRFGEDEAEKPHAQCGGSEKGFYGSVWETVPGSSRWEWEGADCSPEATLRRFERFITRGGVADWSSETLDGFWSSEIHRGHSHSIQDARDRTRRAFAWFSEGSGFRPSEGSGVECARVESVEVQERRSAIELGWSIGDGTVYNLEVDRFHTYFADGVLAHNCHRVGADFFSQSAFRIPAKLRLGLSATPDRSDGRLEVLKAHIGPVMIRERALNMTPKIIARTSPWQIPMTRVRNEKTGKTSVGPIPHSPAKCGHVINIMVKNHARNDLITKFIVAAYHKGRKILVQSDRKDHLEVLATLIASAGIPQANIAYYVGGMTEGQRGLAKKKQVIMATYAMTAEATDIPDLDTLVMGTPKSDVRQIVGRILREHPDKQPPVVFDLIDDSSPVFKGYWTTRRKWYSSIGAEVQLN